MIDSADLRLVEAVRVALRQQRPLVHCLTNAVTIGRVADALAAVGALPVMASAAEEVVDMVAQADALVLNLGTPSAERWGAARLAGQRARAGGVPIALDPVGCGATRWRTEQVRALVAAVTPDIVRGNVPEVAALAGLPAPGTGVRLRGVTADDGARPHPVEDLQAAGTAAQAFAAAASRALGGATVVVTSRVQAISDGRRMVLRAGPDVPSSQLVGTGDVLTALIAACRAVEADSVASCQVAVALCSAAAGRAVGAPGVGPGTFWTRFLDALGSMPVPGGPSGRLPGERFAAPI